MHPFGKVNEKIFSILIPKRQSAGVTGTKVAQTDGFWAVCLRLIKGKHRMSHQDRLEILEFPVIHGNHLFRAGDLLG